MQDDVRVNSDELVRVAQVCGRFVEESRTLVDRLDYVLQGPRADLCRKMLTASIDHSVSIAFLMRAGQPAFAHSAIALCRVQFDTFVRGVFFALPAHSTDKEVDRFLKSDKLPGRPSRRDSPISLSQLAEIARGELENMSREAGIQGVSFENAYQSSVKAFHGFVHGGKIISEIYAKNGDGIIFLPNFSMLIEIVRQSAAITFMAMTCLIVRVSGASTVPIDEAWVAAYEAYFFG
jgi:hypothetical protein